MLKKCHPAYTNEKNAIRITTNTTLQKTSPGRGSIRCFLQRGDLKLCHCLCLQHKAVKAETCRFTTL